MAVVVFPTLLISFIVGYAFRDSGIPVPDLGAFLGDNGPKSAYTLALENYAIWASVFSLAHFVLYVKPQRSFFHPFKLNPNYPSTSLILKEIGRSARGNPKCVRYAAVLSHFKLFLYRRRHLHILCSSDQPSTWFWSSAHQLGAKLLRLR